MVISKLNIDNVRLRIGNQGIGRVREIKYLGCWALDKWDSDVGIETSIEIVRKTFFKNESIIVQPRPESDYLIASH